jgi:hypothetical protein
MSLKYDIYTFGYSGELTRLYEHICLGLGIVDLSSYSLYVKNRYYLHFNKCLKNLTPLKDYYIRQLSVPIYK